MQEVRQKEVVIMEKLTKNAKSKTSKYSSRAFNLILTVSPFNNANYIYNNSRFSNTMKNLYLLHILCIFVASVVKQNLLFLFLWKSL